MSRKTFILWPILGCAAALTLSCVSMRAPPGALSTVCQASPALVGKWRSVRDSQVGRATAKLTLACDCTYEMKVRAFAFFRLRERGDYRAEDGELHFSRANGEVTRWPFQWSGEDLLLSEGDPQPQRYRRVRPLACPSASAD
jgi:hypothetical protein